MNIAKNLEHAASLFSKRPAISTGRTVTTYGQLNEQANRVATALVKLGVKPGDHVGICAPNSGKWLAFYFGLIKAGATAVTMSGQLKSAELVQLVDDTHPRIMFTDNRFVNALKGLQGPGLIEKIISPEGDLDFHALMDMGSASFKAFDVDRNDTAAILFTGGTTGTPKGVLLSHENINTAIHDVMFNERSRETDRALCFLPLHHVFGQMHIMNATILSGGCVELFPSFDMDLVLDALAAGRVTKLFAVPTVYVRLLSLERLKERLGQVRYCFSAATSMAGEIVRQWRERTGLNIFEAYGMTESASMVTYNHYHRHVTGSVGTPAGTVEVQIMDPRGNLTAPGEEGEICIRGRNIMKGYLNRPDETRSVFHGDWLRSGDLGMIDDEGYLFIVDRLKDMIITGGENVYPREIEEILYGRDEVEECSVIGLPDREWGERVTALMIPKSGRTIDTRAIEGHLKSRLSPFKVPKDYRIVSSLPKSPAGKILKRKLKKQLLEQADR